jgi:ribonuclease P protein component
LDSNLRQTLRAAERIKSRKVFEILFERGKSVKAKGIKAIWLITSERLEPFPGQVPASNANPEVRVAFVAPKKLYRLAVERNRAKRQLREAYRLQKQLIPELPNADWHLYILFIYTTRPLKTTPQVASGVATCLATISRTILAEVVTNTISES